MRKSNNMGCIFSFEPNPFVFSTLCDNIESNKSRHIIPICAALVSNEAMLADLSFRKHHSGAGTLKRKLSTDVKVLCLGRAFLDEIADTVKGDFFIKVDVEGLENDVIDLILHSKLAHRVHGLLVEMHPKHNSAEELNDIIRKLGDLGLQEVERSRSSGHCDAYFSAHLEKS
jgi:FkbM family methyltransferase